MRISDWSSDVALPISKTFGSGETAFRALKGVDLDIDTGDFVAVMGPSGSGKSTLLHILGCLDVPTTGQYLFKSVAVEDLRRDQRALLRRRAIGRASSWGRVCEAV